MRVVVFEDAFVDQLAPLTLGRAAYAVGCGGESLATWVSRLGGRICGLVRPHLRAWQAANYPSWSDDAPAGETTLLINARLIPSPHTYDVLRRLYHCAECGQVRVGDHLAAAVLPDDVAGPAALGCESQQQFWCAPAMATLPRLDEDLSLLAFPHEIIHWHLATLADSLTYRIAQGTYREIRDGVFVGAGVHLSEWVYTDTSQGPIVIDSDCTIRPFACISGPARLGERSRVNEHASLRPGVSLGPVCKVGGEVEASVLDEYSNKQHAGYLGHSYLGPWVNLGAGTSNSNLKNSYGSVRMEIAGRRSTPGCNCWVAWWAITRNGRQYQHLHRKTHRRVQHGLRHRHGQCAEFRQLRPVAGRGHRSAARLMARTQKRRVPATRNCPNTLARTTAARHVSTSGGRPTTSRSPPVPVNSLARGRPASWPISPSPPPVFRSRRMRRSL